MIAVGWVIFIRTFVTLYFITDFEIKTDMSVIRDFFLKMQVNGCNRVTAFLFTVEEGSPFVRSENGSEL